MDNCKREYGIPNKVFDDGKVSVGRITSSKDLSKLPIKNDWCINKPNQYQKYMNDGWRFYLIDNGDTSDYIRYVLLMVGDNGKRYYYDLDNNVMNERDIAEFETHLTPEAKFFVEKLQEQTIYKRNKQLKTENRMKRTIQLTESELKCIIRESVKRYINENIDKGPTDRKMVDKRLSLMSDKQREALENLYNEFGKQFDFYDWVWNVTFSPSSKEFDNEDDAVNFAQVMYRKYPFLTKPKIWNNNGRFEVNYEEIRL